MIFGKKKPKLVPFEEICVALRHLASGSGGDFHVSWDKVVEVIAEPYSSDIVSLIGPTVARSMLLQALVMIDPVYAGWIVSRASRCLLNEGLRIFDWCDLTKEFLCACNEKGVVTAVERAIGTCLPGSCSACENRPCLSNTQITVQFGSRKSLEMVLRSLIDDDKDRFEKVDAFFREVLVPAVDTSSYKRLRGADAKELSVYVYNRARDLVDVLGRILVKAEREGVGLESRALVEAMLRVEIVLRSGLSEVIFSCGAESVEKNALSYIQRALSVMYQEIEVAASRCCAGGVKIAIGDIGEIKSLAHDVCEGFDDKGGGDRSLADGLF